MTLDLQRRLDYDLGDPGHNWHRYSVTGPAGAVALAFIPPFFPVLNHWTGADLGYHSATQPDAFVLHEEHCELLLAPCWYNGSSLAAMRFVPLVEAGEHDRLYEILENLYINEFLAPEAN